MLQSKRSFFLYLFPSFYLQTTQSMKRLMLFLSAAISLSISAQTYQKLSEYGIELMEKDSLERAEEAFRQAMKLEPANPYNALLFSNVGIIQRKMGKYVEAEESFTLGLNITPFSIPTLLNRAAVNMELGQTNRSYVDYCQVLDLDKENAEALLMRAYIYVSRRDYNAARIDYNHLLQLQPNHYSGKLGLVSLNQKEKKYSQALDILNAMLRDTPKDATLLMMRAGIEIDMELLDAALLDLEDAIRNNPESADAYIYRGELYLYQNKKLLARQDFERAIALGVPKSELSELLHKCR
jgi:Tfp pilus assembly protein PilF